MNDPPVLFDADGQPRSRRFGDVYFSREGGLAESRAVFLAGCGLPERWAGRRRFTIAELGFGTGLNIAALLEAWRGDRPVGGRLSIFSVEAEPLPKDDAARALGAWPELAEAAGLLLTRWPGWRAGFHRIELPEFGATLDIAVMDAAAALTAWQGVADAWFLDGFAPAVNPDMWSDELMRLVAARSAPGARAATYTVAGQARRALTAAGFDVARRPGFGKKRERLEASLPGAAVEAPAPPRVAVIGAGIAGASLARALRALGASPRLFDAAGRGARASGNPAAMVTPRLDAGLGAAARLHAQALDRARDLYEALDGAVVARGVLRLETAPRDAGRFARIAAADLFAPGEMAPVAAEEVARRLGEPAPAALDMRGARIVAPDVVLGAWAPEVTIRRIVGLERGDGVWRLLAAEGQALEAEIVCVATGSGLGALWPEAPIQPVRGQLTWTDGRGATAAAWGAYVTPTRTGLMFGATHDRDDADDTWRPADDQRNLAALARRLPRLAASLGAGPFAGRAATRAVTPDRLPIAGALAPGLFVLGGLGARGFTLAPLLADHVAALAMGAPSPLPAPLSRTVAPARFTPGGGDAGFVAAGQLL